jgi:hypothetical protein
MSTPLTPWEQAMAAMREDAEMKAPLRSKPRMLHDMGIDEVELEQRKEHARREYDAITNGRKES